MLIGTQPGLERARDPALRAVVDQYTTRAAELGRGVNDWGRRELGVDVAGSASSAWSSVRGGPGGPGGQGGYGRVGDNAGGDDWDSWRDDDDAHRQPNANTNTQPGTTNKTSDWDDWDDKGWSQTPADSTAAPSTKPDSSKAPTAPAKKKDDEWEDW